MGSFDTKNPCNLTVEDQEKLLALLRGNFSYNGKTLFRSKLDANTVTALSIVDGAVISSKLTLGTQNWSTDIVFSPTDHDTVAWTSGSILTSDGSIYSISSGNTGNMAAFTYIYFDTAISLTTLQVTTDYSLVTGDTANLLCVASFIADTSQNAFYIPAIGTFGINSTVISPNSISTSKIQALAITTGLLSAGAVTAAKINVAQLSAIAVDAGTLTAGTIIGLTIKTAASGQRAEMTSANGFRAYNSIGTIVAEMGTTGFNLFQNINGVDPTTNIAIANGSGGITIGANPGGSQNTQIGIIGGASGVGAVAITFLSGSGTSIQFLNTGTKFNGQNINFDSGFGIAQSGQSIALGSNIAMYVSSSVRATVTSTELQLTGKLWVGSSPPSGFSSFHQAWFNGGVVVPNASGYCSVMPDGSTVRFIYNLSNAGVFVLGASGGSTPGTDGLDSIKFQLPTITTGMIIDRTNDATNTCMQLYWNGGLHRVAFDGTQLYLV